MDPLSLRDISPKVEKISGYTKISNGPEFYPPSGGQGGKDTYRNLNSLGVGGQRHKSKFKLIGARGNKTHRNKHSGGNNGNRTNHL